MPRFKTVAAMDDPEPDQSWMKGQDGSLRRGKFTEWLPSRVIA